MSQNVATESIKEQIENQDQKTIDLKNIPVKVRDPTEGGRRPRLMNFKPIEINPDDFEYTGIPCDPWIPKKFNSVRNDGFFDM
ncbi:MAG: hypothetical protein Terrestrivirus1_362 [Terrestrivirus sp.]|uniref:Uncharacterized protein n=1 Tax=Terrestrivirus sp. TaxID=2487775 RepID=A0A3G4ZKY1_9VIRU|nr:MAG: hypothetical protein Terrestrivirus1_362 [Terrestrivirus sp.]